MVVIIAAAIGVSFYLVAMYACLVVSSRKEGREILDEDHLSYLKTVVADEQRTGKG